MSGEIEAAGTAPWTIRRVLKWATQDFAGKGHSTPGLEAELLLCHALQLDRIRLLIDSSTVLEPSQLQTIRALIQRRRTSEPVAYILGKREFYGLDFRVDPRVLIPRPDTETLVEVALQRLSARSLYASVLDLCTGSGCVAIALAKARPTWRLLATDISQGALAAARHNAERLGASHSVSFLHSDLFTGLNANHKFDLITANPPYIPSHEIPSLAQDIHQFEPHLALDGGVDGLVLVRKIITEARAFLNPGGVLALELGAGQASSVATLFDAAGFSTIERQRDYGGHDRVISGVTPA